MITTELTRVQLCRYSLEERNLPVLELLRKNFKDFEINGVRISARDFNMSWECYIIITSTAQYRTYDRTKLC
jgi:hypothetical protein